MKGKTSSGFVLTELLVALVVVSIALALSAQILMEAAQLLTDVAAEQTDAPMPLVTARLRGDVRASTGFDVLPDGSLLLLGHPAGSVVYQPDGRELRRIVLAADGTTLGSATALRGVTAWSCASITPRLLLVTITHRRSRLRPGPLANLPVYRGPLFEDRTESFLVTPRGAGLGTSW